MSGKRRIRRVHLQWGNAVSGSFVSWGPALWRNLSITHIISLLTSSPSPFLQVLHCYGRTSHRESSSGPRSSRLACGWADNRWWGSPWPEHPAVVLPVDVEDALGPVLVLVDLPAMEGLPSGIVEAHSVPLNSCRRTCGCHKHLGSH